MKKSILFLALYFNFFITNCAIASESAEGSGLGAFIPLIIIWAIVYWVLVKPLSKRKGKSQLLELLMLIPIANLIYVIWLASLTDKAVIEDINALKTVLPKSNLEMKTDKASKKDEPLIPEINAEKVNESFNSETTDPWSAANWFQKGVDLFKLGDYRGAINAYNNSINLDPNYLSAYYNRGLVHYKLGNSEQMLINLKIAAKLGHGKSQELLKSKGIHW